VNIDSFVKIYNIINKNLIIFNKMLFTAGSCLIPLGFTSRIDSPGKTILKSKFHLKHEKLTSSDVIKQKP